MGLNPLRMQGEISLEHLQPGYWAERPLDRDFTENRWGKRDPGILRQASAPPLGIIHSGSEIGLHHLGQILIFRIVYVFL